MKKFTGLKKYSLTLIGLLLGAVGGFLYWRYVGCATGTCPITSSPWMSSLWGALLGGSFLGLFQPGEKSKS